MFGGRLVLIGLRAGRLLFLGGRGCCLCLGLGRGLLGCGWKLLVVFRIENCYLRACYCVCR